MTTILNRLEAHNAFSEDSDSKQLRKDAATEIRCLQCELDAERVKSKELEYRLIRAQASGRA